VAPLTRVLFLAERTALPDGGISPHGSSVHVAATLTALRERFDVLAVGAAPAPPEQAAPRLLRALFPARVRGIRRDVGFLREDRAFYKRALEAARSFRPDLIYMRDEYFTFAGLRLSRRLGIPLVLEVNGLLELDARTMYRSFGEPVGAWLERVKLARSDAIVVETSGLAECLEKRGAFAALHRSERRPRYACRRRAAVAAGRRGCHRLDRPLDGVARGLAHDSGRGWTPPRRGSRRSVPDRG
jgi:hypothetical protein